MWIWMSRLEPGHYVVGGPAEIRIYGRAEVFGAEVVETSFRVPANRQSPVSILDGYAEVSGALYIVSIDEDPIPREWRDLASRISPGEKILIIGDVDTGKSGLTLFLANYLVGLGVETGVIDTDLGQSDIGPPGTIGYAHIDRQYTSYMDIGLTDAYFVGDITPTGHLLQVVVGVLSLMRGAEVEDLIINTCGYIRGGAARALKRGLAEAVDPDKVVIIQEAGEARHLVDDLADYRPAVMERPKAIKPKRVAERQSYRRIYLDRFLSGGREVRRGLGDVEIHNTVLGRICYKAYRDTIFGAYWDGETIYIAYKGDRGVIPEVMPQTRARPRYIDLDRLGGLLLGLYRGERFAGLGLLRSLDPLDDSITIYTPVEDFDRIVFGYLILDSEYRVAARLRPGFLG